MSSFLTAQTPRTPIRAAHLDLKGTPPTFERLLKLLDLFVAGGYNALLVEWEDMFPWKIDLQFRCETAYTPEQVMQFHAQAKAKGLEIIPLVQCIGHMETFLNWPQYEHLREVCVQSDVLNVLAKGSGDLVQKLVDEVVSLSPGIRYFHLGGDEAWTFGTHPHTKAYAQTHGKDKLYLQHVEPILDSLIARGIRPILWHDMMVEWSDEQIKRLSSKCDLMVWGYSGHPDTTEHHYNTKHIQRFHDLKVPMWAAGAFKGADGPIADLPLLEPRIRNANAWTDMHARFGFKGLCATGWSRYATHNHQCESIEASLDSLLLVGKAFHDGQAKVDDRAAAMAVLETLGERQRFESIYDTMKRLGYGVQHTQMNAMTIRRLMVLGVKDRRRQNGGFELKYLGWVRKDLLMAEKAAAEMSGRFDGLTDPIWVDRYLQERMHLIREEAGRAEANVRMMNPKGYPTVPAEGQV